MKRLTRLRFGDAVIVSIFLFIISMSLTVGCGGCSTDKGQYNPATGVYDTNAMGDTVVVTAENLRESMLSVFDAFMQVERENEVALKALNPEIHEAAEWIRKNGKGVLDDITRTKLAYQSARTPENASKLNSAIAAGRSALSIASRRLAEAATRKVKP